MTAKNGKPCPKCGGNKWYKNGNCGECAKKKSQKWYEANKEKAAEMHRTYRQKYPERVAARHRAYKQTYPEKNAAQSRAWYAAHPELARERNREYRKVNRENTKALKSRRRTRKTAAGGSFTPGEWKAMIEHYGGKCLCCGRTDVALTADHVIPVSKGGTSNIDNIQPLCLSCNSRKHDKTIDYRPDSGLGRWIQRKLFG